MSTPREVEHGFKHTKVTITQLEIWVDIVYVDAFGETSMQLKGEGAIDMGLLNGIRTSISYSQLSWVMHLLQIFLTRSIVILILLPSGTAKVLIDILFTGLSYCLPVCNEQNIQEHAMAEYKGPWHAA